MTRFGLAALALFIASFGGSTPAYADFFGDHIANFHRVIQETTDFIAKEKAKLDEAAPDPRIAFRANFIEENHKNAPIMVKDRLRTMFQRIDSQAVGSPLFEATVRDLFQFLELHGQTNWLASLVHPTATDPRRIAAQLLVAPDKFFLDNPTLEPQRAALTPLMRAVQTNAHGTPAFFTAMQALFAAVPENQRGALLPVVHPDITNPKRRYAAMLLQALHTITPRETLTRAHAYVTANNVDPAAPQAALVDALKTVHFPANAKLNNAFENLRHHEDILASKTAWQTLFDQGKANGNNFNELYTSLFRTLGAHGTPALDQIITRLASEPEGSLEWHVRQAALVVKNNGVGTSPYRALWTATGGENTRRWNLLQQAVSKTGTPATYSLAAPAKQAEIDELRRIYTNTGEIFRFIMTAPTADQGMLDTANRFLVLFSQEAAPGRRVVHVRRNSVYGGTDQLIELGNMSADRFNVIRNEFRANAHLYRIDMNPLPSNPPMPPS